MATILNSTVREEDRELARRVSAYLASRSFLSFRRLSVSVDQGIVTLSGELSSFHEKQVAWESCRRVAGVRQIVDAIEVRPATASRSRTRLSDVLQQTVVQY